MSQAEHYHFVTGRLAEASVRNVVEKLAAHQPFDYTIEVLPITVAALMTGRWLLRHLQLPPQATCMLLPGYLEGELELIQRSVSIRVECGPKNILDLPQYFGGVSKRSSDYGDYDIEIIAEINNADRLSVDQIAQQADALARDGADIIDLGCTPGRNWTEVARAVAELKSRGHRVSIDSFNPVEVNDACDAGAELVLSVNGTNCESAAEWGCEVVAIPDVPEDWASLQRTVEQLERSSVPYRLDPILQPIGMGLANSIERYARCRREFPGARMMMGIGNVTELTDCDSAGINTLLLGICQELKIDSVLTTQVINWARSSVRECDLARRLVYYAVNRAMPPKHIEPELVLLRDPKVAEFSENAIAGLASSVRDHNFRLFVAGGQIHAVARGLHLSGFDPFEVMQRILASPVGTEIDVQHAFYLGFEMCKALQALTLSKRYEQDEALHWGYLTRPERHWRLKS